MEDDEKEYEVLRQEGNEAYKKKDYDEAVDCYTDAIEAAERAGEPQAAIFANRAAAYMMQNNFKKAILDCQAAIRIDDKYVKAYQRAGKCMVELGEYTRASDFYSTGLELDPKNKDLKKELNLIKYLKVRRCI